MTRVALITGATGGLGTALTDAFRSAGWDVATTDLPSTTAEFGADLCDRDAPGAVISDVLGSRGRLDLLVNNAATMYYGLLDADDLPRWWKTIDVNLSAPFRFARAACGELKRTAGQIINVASSHGVKAEAGFSAYCASKAGVIGLTKALALELAPAVRVNAVAPGHMDTSQQLVDAAVRGITREELYDAYAHEIPIGRVLLPEEVARFVVFLSDETGYTGACLHLNGGTLLV
jgi:NAD(P)-dependent dehydrogenase (short-subunit alcohol dehydrogenase family)